MRSSSYSEFVRLKAESERYMAEYWIQQEQDNLCLNARATSVSNINMSKNVMRMISGWQRATRKNIVLLCDSDDVELQKSVDYYGIALSKTALQARIYENLSLAFYDGVAFGVSAVALNFSDRGLSSCYISSPSIIFDENFFSSGDFNSCNFVGLRKKISRADTFVKYPEQFNEIEQSAPVTFNESSFFFRNYFLEDHLFKWKVGKYIEILAEGGRFLVQKDSPRHRKVIQRLLLLKQPFNEKEISRKVPSLVRFINGVEVESIAYPFLPDCFPCIALTGNVFSPFENYNAGRWSDSIQGAVRELRDLQSMMGRTLSSIDSILDSTRINGWLYRQGATDEDVINSMQKYGNIPVVAENVGEAVQRLQPPDLPESYTGFVEQLLGLLKVVGVNEELMGLQSENKDSGALLSMLRQSAGLVTLNKYFDMIDHATKRAGETILSFLLQMDPAYLQSIVGLPMPHKSLTPNIMRVVIEEGLDTDLQKRRRFTQLVELFQLGILEDKAAILDAAPLQNKSRIMEMTIQQSQQQQQQMQTQQQQQQQMQALDSEMTVRKTHAEVLKAKSQADKNLADTRKADSQTMRNIAEVQQETI